MLTRGSADSLSRIRVSLSHSPPSLVTARLTAMAAAPAGAVAAAAWNVAAVVLWRRAAVARTERMVVVVSGET